MRQEALVLEWLVYIDFGHCKNGKHICDLRTWHAISKFLLGLTASDQLQTRPHFNGFWAVISSQNKMPFLAFYGL